MGESVRLLESSAVVLGSAAVANVAMTVALSSCLMAPSVDGAVKMMPSSEGKLSGPTMKTPYVEFIQGTYQDGTCSWTCSTTRSARVQFKMVKVIDPGVVFTSDLFVKGTTHACSADSVSGGAQYDIFIRVDATINPDLAWTELTGPVPVPYRGEGSIGVGHLPVGGE